MKMVKTLLEYGADIKAKNMVIIYFYITINKTINNQALKTPKDVAIYHGHRQVYNVKCLTFIIQFNNKINIQYLNNIE